MYSVIVNQQPLGIVTLAEAKAQCRVTHEFDDELFTSLITVASDMAQKYTNRMLSEGSAVSVVESYQPVVQLPYGEVTDVTDLILDDVASTDFTFEPVTQKITINTEYTKAKITFSAGYSTVPPTVRHAVLLTVSTLYNNRDNYVTGLTVAKMPMTAERMLDSVKYYAI